MVNRKLYHAEKMKTYAHRTLWLIFNLSLPVALIYGITQSQWLWLLAMCVMIPIFGGGFGIAIAMHRYLSHRSFKTTKIKHTVLSLAAFLSGQGSSVTWSMIHRHHHLYSDTEKDIHSPKYGVFDAGLSWILQPREYYLAKGMRASVKDLLNDPLNAFLHRHYYVLWFGILILGTVINWQALLFLLLAPIGKGYIDAFLTNTIGHIKTPGSYRNFELKDNSQNMVWYSYFCLGEGMHNNHHAKPYEYDQNFYCHDVDIAGKFISRYLVEFNPNKIYKFQ